VRICDLYENRWWGDSPLITLYHGTSSAFVDDIRREGLKPPNTSEYAYALEVLEQYISRDKWTPALIRDVKMRAGLDSLRRSESILYFFTTSKAVEGYAVSYAQHGGEIAHDVYQTANLFLNDEAVMIKDVKMKIQPRFFDARPVVVEVEVPKSWVVSDGNWRERKENYKRAWEAKSGWATKFDSLAALCDDAFNSVEVHVGRAIPPSMIKSVRYV
jgi:hypothetical protein